MKTKAVSSMIVLAIVFVAPASARPMTERLAADIQGAEHSILVSLALHKSSQSASLCSRNEYACLGVDGAEQGLALIAASRSAVAPRSLVNLVRFQMDAGLSEDYKCYVGYRGESVVQPATNADAKRLSEQCQSEVAAFKKRAAVGLDVTAERLCRSPEQIRVALREVVELSKSNLHCDGT